MRTHKAPNPQLMAYFEKEILPLVPYELKTFDDRLNLAGLPQRKYFLFGSFAEGKPSLRSDVDVAVVFDDLEIVLSSAFYGLLGEKGMLTRIKGARVEMTLFDEDDIEIMRHENPGIREIKAERENISPERLG
ncbi:hypothetical protein A3A84_01765 [Candidatus Collierbacteria bacterium RIFCSPLOWO2_01_FULL_50_23]|uniref:Polymerase beta nucleotidyltransferase domain-containing protein n=2 Tax=Candidatus Collieribacteriota TaxID=1752725 RepID=A0A1F5EXL7_9BACT|nr:MAG: hypothetical protein A3D09_03950 [Candidatus Collierbacteria bacterium RIFCSPHIGHO2_02_FULL_49_10]OGD72316.1 MAG: hypothetical protein A2703_02070 [Candidatus Collierbacteria bacterium RIFCSPHIGHO2_01_FULL_50_25]OGD75254.1 MAG: hypothetical protein A3A84_01765 [Candidatus Collierbacteria bacterium RIFCSPLOWO2_01_FULL_50_23]